MYVNPLKTQFWKLNPKTIFSQPCMNKRKYLNVIVAFVDCNIQKSLPYLPTSLSNK